jgi:hypothetical protein
MAGLSRGFLSLHKLKRVFHVSRRPWGSVNRKQESIKKCFS